jgi:hypothetical protein
VCSLPRIYLVAQTINHYTSNRQLSLLSLIEIYPIKIGTDKMLMRAHPLIIGKYDSREIKNTATIYKSISAPCNFRL